MNKLFSLLLIAILCIGLPLQGFALSSGESALLTKNIIIAKSNLENDVAKGKRYVKAIDKLIEQKKDDKAYLERLVSKLDEKYWDVYLSENPNTDILYVISYINAKASLKIAKIESAENALLLQEVVSGTDISDADKEKVEDKMLSLQSSLIDSSEELFDILEKYTSYEQSGSSEMRLNIDEESFGTVISEFKITDYISKNNLFDSQISGDVEGRLEYSIAGRDLKLEFSSFVDAIIKDDEFYLLLDNVKSTIETENSELKGLIDISKKISTEGKYVRFSDENLGEIELSKEMIENALNINKYRSLLENPVLKTYKKDGDKYYLIPTEEFCSEAKKLFGGILGNIGDDGCSEDQYNDILEGFVKDTNAYMVINGSTSTIYMEERGGASSMDISFNSNDILSVNMEIVDNSPYLGESRMTMSYLKGKSINAAISMYDGSRGTFDSTLNADNSFRSFDLLLDGGEDFNMTMSLANEKLEGSINASSFGEELFTADMSGTLKKDYLDMEMDFEFIDFIQRSEEKIKGDMTMMIDTRNNKSDADFGFNIEKEGENIIEFEILSESTIKYGEVKIEAPTDFVEAEDVWGFEDDDIYEIY